jgi:hypothetical protein
MTVASAGAPEPDPAQDTSSARRVDAVPSAMPRFIGVDRLMREFGLPWQRAEAIIREQAARTRRHPLVVSCFLGGFLMGSVGVPLLVAPQHRLLAMLSRLGCLAVMVAGPVLVRVLARRSILRAAMAERWRG